MMKRVGLFGPVRIADSSPATLSARAKTKGARKAPFVLAIGGESGIRTRDTALTVYTLSRRAP